MADNHQPQAKQVESQDDQIRVAAYYKWLAAGSPAGRHLDFWCAAEQEFAGARQEAPPPPSDDRAKPHREITVRPKELPAPEKRTETRSKPRAAQRQA